MNHKPMLNAYPDSLGGNLGDIVTLLKTEAMQDVFSSFYILPSLYHSDLDRGFSVIDYDLNEQLADREDLDQLKNMGIDLKLDFILNHASAQSPQFQDLVEKGEASAYRDFFIDWNRFWEGHGTMTEEGYIQPEESCLKQMFFRKPGLPILMVEFPDGKKVPYWNTFYQEVHGRQYLGQMDVNIQSPKVWEFYRETLEKIATYGAAIVRLDAFAYAPKTPGLRNFMNEPDTWDTLERIRQMADSHGLTLLPEIHDPYAAGTYEKVARKGYMTYDFFLPGLVIDAIENHDGTRLMRWAEELREKNIRTVNMLGCHDGIPMLDLKGLLSDTEIEKLIALIVSRGGMIKNLHGAKNVYYQVNCTYFSALGADERKMLLARAIQLFMPGKPQVWYLDLFAGENDLEAVRRGGEAAHKEINRTNLTRDAVADALKKDVVRDQLALLRMRNTCPAFDFDADMTVRQPQKDQLEVIWEKDGSRASLRANLTTYEFAAQTDCGAARTILTSR
mgnify:CR=1 FL=1